MTQLDGFVASLGPQAQGPYGEVGLGIADVRMQVEALGNGQEWQRLTPNAPSVTDMTPAEVSGADLATVYDAVMAMPGFGESLTGSAVDGKTEVVRHPANQLIDLGNAGQLSFVDAGQSKAVWRWSRGGKSMALGIEFDGNYISREGQVQMPDDPNLIPMGTKSSERYSEFSDLRTYLRIPVGDHFIKLQEFGEAPSTAAQLSHSKVEEAKLRVRGNILRAAPAADMRFTDDELKHGRHYLRKEGYDDLFVIDIPVKEVLSQDQAIGADDMDTASEARWAQFATGDRERRGIPSRHGVAVGALGRVITGRSSADAPRHARSNSYTPRHRRK
jgi:hypothetical protein